MKMDFLFSGLNLNIIIQKKVPEKCTFCVWCLKNIGHQNFKCWDFVADCGLGQFGDTLSAMSHFGDGTFRRRWSQMFCAKKMCFWNTLKV